MAYSNGYGKPMMTNLPADLGREIFRQILSTSAPDYDRLHQEAQRVEKAIVDARRREEEQGNTAH